MAQKELLLIIRKTHITQIGREKYSDNIWEAALEFLLDGIIQQEGILLLDIIIWILISVYYQSNYWIIWTGQCVFDKCR